LTYTLNIPYNDNQLARALVRYISTTLLAEITRALPKANGNFKIIARESLRASAQNIDKSKRQEALLLIERLTKEQSVATKSCYLKASY